MASQPPIVVIPARMASVRLPGKPLSDINGEPMIVHVWRRAMDAGIGPVLVACAEAEIARAVTAAGGEAVLTDPELPSGSDRVLAAARAVDPDGRHEIIVNLQGDLPTVAPGTIRAAVRPMADPAVDIGTCASVIREAAERDSPDVVKAVAELADGAEVGRALYFTRGVSPAGPGAHYHHIGLYAWRRAALERFVAAPPGVLERRERLEQLRALALGMRIDVAVVDAVPLGVDTPADLARARAILAGRP